MTAVSYLINIYIILNLSGYRKTQKNSVQYLVSFLTMSPLHLRLIYQEGKYQEGMYLVNPRLLKALILTVLSPKADSVN